MKFSFKVQRYQTDAVNAAVDVFGGQQPVANDDLVYQIDKGTLPVDIFDSLLGYANAGIQLNDSELLQNINAIQRRNDIHSSQELARALGKCSLDIEMETGTGKTYVYIKTMFELNKRYGWNKFIIIVPSVAIREGVKKSFAMMEEHFMEQYGKKARYFIYDSGALTKIDDFAQSNEINVMIINCQAFAKSFNEEKNKDGRGGDKGARIIFRKSEKFGWRRPIDVIAKTNPILILDEPQKLGGAATQNGMKKFCPLFSLNYSATHKDKHDLVYVLDAVTAYNHKLVKQIEVKGVEVKNLQGVDGYLYCHEFVVQKNKAPRVKLEFEVQQASGIKRIVKTLEANTDLFFESNGMKQYEGYKISNIHIAPDGKGVVSFTNGITLQATDVLGDVSEEDKRRIQIRETIKSHFEKEKLLFDKGIKTLSLFFIDKVEHYRVYDADGNAHLGKYGQIFEEEYQRIYNDKLQELFASEDPYLQYLHRYAGDVHAVHTGYFSIDNKGHSIDSKLERGQDTSNDTDAYDLIMKNKERLLSFEEPVRFIFSHSALREGWDNPNIFQICTLKNSNNETNKRQEVGRGMRLCVNQAGERMDAQSCGEAMVHKINELTVIASESYAEFVSSLQDEIKAGLYNRPAKAEADYFAGRIVFVDDKEYTIPKEKASQILLYLGVNGYADLAGKVTDKYKEAAAKGEFAPLQPELEPLAPAIHKLVQSIFDPAILQQMVKDGRETKIKENRLNSNFAKKEFQALWHKINHKYAYTVQFDSNELIKKAVDAINRELLVKKVQYRLVTGRQKNEIKEHDLQAGNSFAAMHSKTRVLDNAHDSGLKYDLLHEIAARTSLTRKTIADILQEIEPVKFMLFRDNPVDFINNVSAIINVQKSSLVVDHISYNTTEGTFDSDIFTAEYARESFARAFKAEHAIQDYVFTDGIAEKSVERRFVEELDKAQEVVVYAKLPKGFYIPTPMGRYSPDWAIAFKEGTVKHVYFVAETKGTLESAQLRAIEHAKIKCAKKLFDKLSDGAVHYGQVTSYQDLMNIVADCS